MLNGQDEIRTHKMFYIRRLAIGYTSPVAACPCWLVYYLLKFYSFIHLFINKTTISSEDIHKGYK